MYKELTIKNIKTFEKEQKLKLAPITLIYGENSSGKTTLLKTFDIVHNIFRPSAIMRGNKSAGAIKLEKGSSEDIKNISARKIHFFSSQANNKPLQIELTVNLPFYHSLNKNAALYSDHISEEYVYNEEYIPPKKGKGITVKRKTLGTNTYVTDKMPDGSFRKMIITDTGEGSGKNKKFKITTLGSSIIRRSKNKFKMVPGKFFIEIKYFPGLKLSKVNKLKIKNINNKTIISFTRVPKQYSFPTDKSMFGFIHNNNFKQTLKRHTQDNPDFFTSSAGYSDYKIDIQKENNIWERSYKKYEKIFSNDKKINIRLDKIKLLFKALNFYKLATVLNKSNDLDIGWEDFSMLVTCYILGNNKTEYLEMEKTIKSLFRFSDKNFPRNLDIKNIDHLLREQSNLELLDGNAGWEGMPPNEDRYFVSSIRKKHPDAEKNETKILVLSGLFKNGRGINFFLLQNFLNKKLSFKKFCVMARNSYKDTYLRFKRTPTIGTGGISELRHQFVNDVGQVQDTSFEIFNSFLNYIYGDINEAFTEDGFVRKYSTHFLINNFLNQIRKTVQGFVPCQPSANNAQTSYNIPMKEDFDWEAIEKAIGQIAPGKNKFGYGTNQYKSFFNNFKKYVKSKGMKYKEISITSDYSTFYGHINSDSHKQLGKLFKNSKRVQREVRFPDSGYVADFIVEDQEGKKTVIEVKRILKKKKIEQDFTSLPADISANGDNFDDVICNNKELRQELNRKLKSLLNLKLIVVSPEWIKSISDDAFARLREQWDRGASRNLWSLRKNWPKKDKFLMLQDLNFNRFFNIHGKEVGKGPSNILPFLAQILSKKPNLTYLIQELENNWHPKNQRKIIEAIVDVMKKSEYKNFILETHSEIFILTVQKLVQKGILKPEEVSINYISRSKDGSSNVHHIPLNSQGGFEKAWPGGFFNERMEVLTS